MQFTAGTGINPWWRYQEENIPGGGHLMVNVGTGNLVLQGDDMSVPHKGIALAFRRTYNSQSQHDVTGTDGSVPGMYGNGWTSTFDAHVSATGLGNMTVWDIDGAHYEYTLASDGVTWIPPPGQHAILTPDGTGMGVLWTKKSGTTYYFCLPANSTMSGTAAEAQYGAYEGRLHQIIGRSRNTYITLNYSWDSGSGPGGKFSAISAVTESGMSATLTFADVSGHRLLDHLTYPDGVTTVYYGYDAAGNLTSVSKPPNNAAGTRPLLGFGYAASGGLLTWVASPRWNGPDGGALFYFSYAGTTAPAATVSGISHFGVVNPSIADGTGVPLQPGAATGAVDYNDSWYGTGGGSSAWFHDTDGHSTNWVLDSGRPVQTQECTAMSGWNCTGIWLVTNETWNGSNNLTSEVDARGYQTDYAYDANGNTVAMAEPSTAVQTAGGNVRFRPTKLFSYDAFSNVIAACDEAWSHRNGRDWDVTGNPGTSDALCPAVIGTPQQPGPTVITMAYPSYEPAGQISSIANAMGFHHTLGYAAGPQQGQDYSLPTDVTDDAIPQRDGTTVQRHQYLAYDASGNLTSYNTGTGTWSLAYDALGRLTTATDPDGFASYRFYNSDGSVQRTESAAQHATNQGVAFDYDLDGNVLHETHHFACLPNQTCTPGVTTKWYDGADRLVEVRQPQDPSDFYTFPWSTRYLYDLTQGGTVSLSGGTMYRAYGNLYKTQELLASASPTWCEPAGGCSTGMSGPTSWMDLTGTEVDALDRPTHQYRLSSALTTTGSTLAPTVAMTYDGSGALGLLSSKCNSLNECMYYAYEERGKTVQASSNLANTPTRTYTFDEDGRMATAISANGSIADSYDGAGNLTQRVQSGAGGAASLTYHVYPDGKRAALDINAGAGGSAQNVLAYSYHADGLLGTLAFAYGGTADTWTFAYSSAGRLQQRSDLLSSGPDSFTYAPSGYGHPTAFSIAGAASESALTYDAEGALTIVDSHQASFTSRGELKEGFGGSDGSNNFVGYANGVRITGGTTEDASAPPKSAYSFDALLGIPKRTSPPGACADALTPCTPVFSKFTNYKYDAAGRLPKNYDAEDHPLGQSSGYSLNARNSLSWQTRYAWGPIGHPFAIGSTSVGSGTVTPTDFVDEALYWDHDQLLFTQGTTTSGYGIDNIKIADLAEYINKPGTAVGVTTWHRDAQGQNPACYAIPDGSPFLERTQNCNEPGAPFPHGGRTPNLVGHGAIVGTPRTDGIYDGFNSIQGARAFDTQAGIWSSPDAYTGDVHDPMSQKAYMWNANNPYAYSDPSGYESRDTFGMAHYGTVDAQIASTGTREDHHEDCRQGDEGQAIAYIGKPKPADEEPKQPEKTKKQSKQSQKERSTDRPSWVSQMPDAAPKPGENGNDYATRMIHERYTILDNSYWARGPNSEYNKIRKWFDRGKK